MLRSSLIAAGAVLLCGTSYAQQTLDASKLRPVTQPPQYAGTYNVTTHRWVSPQRASAIRGGNIGVYDNTCTWSGGAFYLPYGVCNDNVDEGRIPGGALDTNAPAAATADNLINTVVFSYCTDEATSTGFELDFFDNLGGGCLGGIPVLPTGIAPPAGFSPWVNVPGLAGAFAIGAGVLPGDTQAGAAPPGNGIVSCWLVGVTFGNGGFCMQSNGNGIFDNSAVLDNFNWVWQMTTPTVFASDGVLLSGDPSVGGGTCTYNIPCAPDPYFTTSVCGHGLDTQDMMWINIDGINVPGGGPGPGCPPYGILAGGGCYWFGGYPANVFASFYLRLESAGECAGCTGGVTEVCDPTGTSGEGCTPDASWVGTPSCDLNGDFIVTWDGLNENKSAIVVIGYGLTGAPVAGPWNPASTRCFSNPPGFTRTASVNTGDVDGTTTDCGGQTVFNVEANLAAYSVGPTDEAYAFVVQEWYRDPAQGGKTTQTTTMLSDAVYFFLCPP